MCKNHSILDYPNGPFSYEQVLSNIFIAAVSVINQMLFLWSVISNISF